jgi:hypothetical protein
MLKRYHHTSQNTGVITARNSNYVFNVCDIIKKYTVTCKATYNINSSIYDYLHILGENCTKETRMWD